MKSFERLAGSRLENDGHAMVHHTGAYRSRQKPRDRRVEQSIGPAPGLRAFASSAYICVKTCFIFPVRKLPCRNPNASIGAVRL
jgi:hypothetical protein